jgi:hypothetical protein
VDCGTLQVNFSRINAEQGFLIENFIFQCISTNLSFCFFILYVFGVGKNFTKVESCHKDSFNMYEYIYHICTKYEQQQQWKVYICYHLKIKPHRRKSLTSKFLSYCINSNTSVIPHFMYTYLYTNFITFVHKISCITLIHPNNMTYSTNITN